MAAAPVAGMILGLVGLKRRRAQQEDNGDDKSDEEGQRPPAATVNGDVPAAAVGNHCGGSSNGGGIYGERRDGHAMEGVAAVASRRNSGGTDFLGSGSGGNRGTASGAADEAMNEGHKAEPLARQPGRAVQESTQPLHADVYTSTLANANSLFTAKTTTVGAVEAATSGGGAALLLWPPSCDSMPRHPAAYIPPNPPSTRLLSGLSPYPPFSSAQSAEPSRSPSLPGPQARTSDQPQHFFACASETAAAASNQPQHVFACAAETAARAFLLDTASTACLSPLLAWPQLLDGEHGGDGEGNRKVAGNTASPGLLPAGPQKQQLNHVNVFGGGEGSRRAASGEEVARAGGLLACWSQQLIGGNGGSGDEVVPTPLAEVRLTPVQLRALQDLLASVVASDDVIAPPADRVVTPTVVNAADAPKAAPVPDRAASFPMADSAPVGRAATVTAAVSTVAVGANASQLPVTAGEALGHYEAEIHGCSRSDALLPGFHFRFRVGR